MLRHLVAKFTTNASGAIWWSNFQLMQVGHLVAKFATNASHGVNFWVRCASVNVFCIIYIVSDRDKKMPGLWLAAEWF